MKKILAVSAFAILVITACNSESKESNTTETGTSTSDTTNAGNKDQQIKDSTTMLDKKLADPNSNYSPDSIK